MIIRFAAFFLSAFPNTTDYKIPQGVLQGTAFNANTIHHAGMHGGVIC